MKSNVYVIGFCDGPYKIGHAKNLNHRMSGLQVGSHKKLQLFASRPTDTPVECEKAAHEKLARFRLSGEWFSCSLKEACEAIGQEQSSVAGTDRISAASFARWVDVMRDECATAREACAALLGFNDDQMNDALILGGPPSLGLACSALYHRIGEWK